MTIQRHHRNEWLGGGCNGRRSLWRHGRWHWLGFGNHRASEPPRAQSNMPWTNVGGITAILGILLAWTLGSTRCTRQDTG